MVPKPATMPVAMPSTLGLPNLNHSMLIQASDPAAAAMWVTSIAIPAAPFAANALPALNPNQPTQSIDAPVTVMVKLCGRKPAAIAEHERRDQRRDAGVQMYDRPSGEIAETHRGEPAAPPHPMGDG